ncbi:hypothetical protein HGRIS_000244 [Hohenbuehelia grisea]|uniref:Uncharacterized protein n=1 Tax=Hohenbuehelia grisea TaxID=104357 RepID=A0ABR3JRM2_9AGAR
MASCARAARRRRYVSVSIHPLTLYSTALPNGSGFLCSVRLFPYLCDYLTSLPDGFLRSGRLLPYLLLYLLYLFYRHHLSTLFFLLADVWNSPISTILSKWRDVRPLPLQGGDGEPAMAFCARAARRCRFVFVSIPPLSASPSYILFSGRRSILSPGRRMDVEGDVYCRSE